MLGPIDGGAYRYQQAQNATPRQPAADGEAAAQPGEDRLGAVAQHLGVSKDALLAKLGDGSRLDDIAASTGATTDDLVAGFFTTGLKIDTYA